MSKIEVNSVEWVSLLDEIQLKHTDGSLISHEYLKEKFRTETLSFSDYENVDEFIIALNNNRFQPKRCISKFAI